MNSLTAFGLKASPPFVDSIRMEFLKHQAIEVDREPLQTTYNLTLGEPKLSEFPNDVFDELHKVEKINNYYPALGDSVLRQKIIDKYYGYNETLSVENIAITHGAIGALDILFRSHLNSENEILIPDPGFPPYENLVKLTGAKVLKYQIHLEPQKSLIDWRSVVANVTSRTRLILINSPHNPTGRLFSKVDLCKLRSLLKHFPNLMFIMDEVYRELIYTHASHYDFTDILERGYIVNSFSKVYPMQGARIGWVVAKKENIEKMSVFFSNAYGAISSFGQELAKLIMSKETNYKCRYVLAKCFACSILDKYGVTYLAPEGTFFIMVHYGFSDQQMIQELESLGVLAVGGSAFGKSGSGYIRLSFAQTNETIKKAFTIVGKHWQDRNGERILC